MIQFLLLYTYTHYKYDDDDDEDGQIVLLALSFFFFFLNSSCYIRKIIIICIREFTNKIKFILKHDNNNLRCLHFSF